MGSRLFALVLLTATALFGQFSQFAATDDGKQVYFISSLILSGSTDTTTQNRMYRIGADGVILYAQAPGSLSSYLAVSSAGGIGSPQVSGDGTVVGYTLQNTVSLCNPFVACTPNPVEAELQGAKTTDLGPGTLQLSRNGRWALVTQSTALNKIGGTQLTDTLSTLIDLRTGQHAFLSASYPLAARAIASDGSVLLQNGIWKQGATTPLPSTLNSSYTPLALSDDASTVIAMSFVSGQQGSLSLTAINIASGKFTTIRPQTSNQLPLYMALSNDGKRVLYRFPGLASADGPAYFADTSSGVSTAITLPQGETVLDGTLSGDGTIAILATNLGRILRVTLAAGTIEALIPPTPYVTNLTQLAIGSFMALTTTYPAEWTGALLLNGKPLPVLATKPGEVDVQVPWEEASGLVSFQVNLQTGSPFQQIQSVLASGIAPNFLLLGSGQTAIFPIDIIKGDWSGFQTTQPQAGDIVYIYMTGLGPVTGPVQTGVATPLNAVEPIQSSLTCTFTPQTTPAQTLFAGLAPGLIGIYQVAFRIPADPNTNALNGMQCSLSAGASFGFGIIGASTIGSQ